MLLLFLMWLFMLSPVIAQSQLYWVGELSNNWNQPNWSTSSNGGQSVNIPDSSTHVVFAAKNAKLNNANLSTSANIRSIAFIVDSQVSIAKGGVLSIGSGNLAASNGASAITGEGSISAPGNVVKTGDGKLRFDTNFYVAGEADIQSGAIVINGNLLANSVRIQNTASLSGNGTVFSPVIVSGTIAPGNSVGRLTVGSLQLTDTSQTLIEVASQQSNDLIVVKGEAALGGRLVVSQAGGHKLSYGDSHIVIVSTARIKGAFDSISLPSGFRGRFLNSGQVGSILVAPDSYTRLAATPNQRSAGRALDTYIPATKGDRASVSLALDQLTSADYPIAFEQTSPAIYATLPMALVEQAYNQSQQLSQRLALAKNGVGAPRYIGLSAAELRYDRDGKSVADPKTVLPTPQEIARANWKSWAMATGQFSKTKDLPGIPSNRNNAGGFLAGLDYNWSKDFITGLFAGYQYSQASFQGGGSSKGNGLYFGLYSAYANEGGFHADAIIGSGYTRFQTRRSVSFGTINRTAYADPGAGLFNASLNFGKDWRAGNFVMGPLAGLQYTYASTTPLTEQGAQSLDLAVDSIATNSLRSSLGARAFYVWSIGKDFKLLPEIRALWIHEFLAQPLSASSSLDGGRGASMGYETASLYQNSLFAGAGLGFRFGEQFTGSLFYNVNLADSNFINNIILITRNFWSKITFNT